MANINLYPFGVGGGDASGSGDPVLRQAIETIHQGLANLAFKGKKPSLPWDEQEQQETYIQDGLVLHLDGINKGGVDNQWTDLINGVDFPNHAATELENGWQFDGINSYLGYSNNSLKSLGFIAENCTVEVALYDDSINASSGSSLAGDFIFAFGANSAVGTNSVNKLYFNMCHAYNAKYINGIYVGNSTNVWRDTNIESVQPHTISINKERAFDNELSLISLGVNHWDSIGGGRTIGAKYHSGNKTLMNFFKGTIYSIRVYNRILTESEMRQNQRVDNERFNLGITF